jgi:hypothetical protein
MVKSWIAQHLLDTAVKHGAELSGIKWDTTPHRAYLAQVSCTQPTLSLELILCARSSLLEKRTASHGWRSVTLNSGYQSGSLRKPCRRTTCTYLTTLTTCSTDLTRPSRSHQGALFSENMGCELTLRKTRVLFCKVPVPHTGRVSIESHLVLECDDFAIAGKALNVDIIEKDSVDCHEEILLWIEGLRSGGGNGWVFSCPSSARSSNPLIAIS